MPVTEIVRLTRHRLTVSYRDSDQYLTPELRIKLQAFWAKRIEEMAYRIMTGTFPVRELPTLDSGTFARMFPVGSGGSEASQDARGRAFPGLGQQRTLKLE